MSDDLVQRAAKAIGCTVYQLFAQAFAAEFGKAERKDVQDAFMLFMEEGVFPYWVETYCRSAINEQEEDSVDGIQNVA
jgi:hypothetical protein